MADSQALAGGSHWNCAPKCLWAAPKCLRADEGSRGRSGPLRQCLYATPSQYAIHQQTPAPLCQMLAACLLRLDVNKTARGQWRSCVAPSHSKPSTLVSLGNSARFRLFGCALHDTSVCVKTCTAPSAHKSRTLMAQRKKGGGYRDGTLPLLPKSFGAHFSAPSPLQAASLVP